MAWTVSVKGVVIDGDRVLLARNERDEWELPGGQLEVGETLAQCVAREIREESSLQVDVDRVLDAWVFEVVPGRQVLIVAYVCILRSDPACVQVSHEHSDVGFIPFDDLADIALPDGYRRAIQLARGKPAD